MRAEYCLFSTDLSSPLSLHELEDSSRRPKQTSQHPDYPDSGAKRRFPGQKLMQEGITGCHMHKFTANESSDASLSCPRRFGSIIDPTIHLRNHLTTRFPTAERSSWFTKDRHTTQRIILLAPQVSGSSLVNSRTADH